MGSIPKQEIEFKGNLIGEKYEERSGGYLFRPNTDLPTLKGLDVLGRKAKSIII